MIIITKKIQSDFVIIFNINYVILQSEAIEFYLN